jgi:cytochrome c2
VRSRSWSVSLLAAALAVFSTTAAADGNPAGGEKIFKKCAVCHTVTAGKNKMGPCLADVIGRQAGTLDGYKSSKAMVADGESGLVWEEATLSTYLANPRAVVKGTKMAFLSLKKEDESADVIAYLKQLSN